jgi:DNA (cytosine-5)-methyltransferase 1
MTAPTARPAAPPIFGSTFSGIGGLDVALQRAGWGCRWQIEIDGAANRVLARRWPDVRRYGDIAAIDPAELEPVDLLCGGFPCQDLSVAGARAGLAGARSGLFHEFVRLAAGLRPRWLLIENVPGLLSSNGGRDMGTVLGALAELGYGWAYRCLDAQHFGLAQRRLRVFIVGCLGDPARAAQVLFEPVSGIWDSPPRREAGARFAAGTADGAQYAHISRPLTTRSGQRHDESAETYAIQNDCWSRSGDAADGVKAPGLGIAEAGEPMFTLDTVKAHAVAFNMNAYAQDAQESLPGTLAADHMQAVAFTERSRAAGRTFEAQEELAYALTNPGSGGRTHSRQIAQGMTVRRLTPLECCRLQGFPDNWLDIDGLSDSARYRLLGNAVAVPVATWIARRMMAVLR